MDKEKIIFSLIKEFPEIRYAAIYDGDELVFQQRENTTDASSGESDKYEELLVNPALLKLASQRGNIDCGGLDYLIVSYGNFFQLVKEFGNGHVSICLDKEADLNNLPRRIIKFLVN